MVCVFGLLGAAVERARAGNWWLAIGLIALAGLFLGDILFVVSSRTSLFVAPILLLLLGWREFRWKGVLAAVVLGIAVSWRGLAELALSARAACHLDAGVERYRDSDTANSTGLRAEFLRKISRFLRRRANHRPWHRVDTAAIPLCRTRRRRRRGVPLKKSAQSDFRRRDPAWRGWRRRCCLRCGSRICCCSPAAACWPGSALTVVAEIVSSLFNSHLFDFTGGLALLFGVGVPAAWCCGRDRKSVRRRCRPPDRRRHQPRCASRFMANQARRTVRRPAGASGRHGQAQKMRGRYFGSRSRASTSAVSPPRVSCSGCQPAAMSFAASIRNCRRGAPRCRRGASSARSSPHSAVASAPAAAFGLAPAYCRDQVAQSRWNSRIGDHVGFAERRRRRQHEIERRDEIVDADQRAAVDEVLDRQRQCASGPRAAALRNFPSRRARITTPAAGS